MSGPDLTPLEQISRKLHFAREVARDSDTLNNDWAIRAAFDELAESIWLIAQSLKPFLTSE